MEEEFIVDILHKIKGNLGYGTCSKYLAYSIESQVVGFGIETSVWNFYLDKRLALGYQKKLVVEYILSKSSGW